MSDQTREKIKSILDKTSSNANVMKKEPKSSFKKFRKTCIFNSTSRKNNYIGIGGDAKVPSTVPFRTADTIKKGSERGRARQPKKFFNSLKHMLTKTSIGCLKNRDNINLFHLSEENDIFSSRTKSKICDFLKKNDTWSKIETMKGMSRGTINLESAKNSHIIFENRSSSQKTNSKENYLKRLSPKKSLRNSFFKPISIKKKDFLKRKILREKLKYIKNDYSHVGRSTVDYSK